MATTTRRNVHELGDEWADPILWYARGVRAMKARPLDEPTGWRFYAAIHGITGTQWRRLGALSSSDAIPDASVQQEFWQQCQHGSWYFLPWHRGYLLAFEAVVRDAVVGLGGPEDWALPYWNYFRAGQDVLPPAFGSPDWPDGTGDNPLFVRQRYGPSGDGDVRVLTDFTNLDALGEPVFTSVGGGGSTGFGGIDTGFLHGGPTHGRIESEPHDSVHGMVGGARSQTDQGVMSRPDTAGLDPIFWLHHANIDRLWESWLRDTTVSHLDPSNARWLGGPTVTGERAFVLPLPAGKTLTYTPADMRELKPLGYEYDDLTPGEAPPPSPVVRLERLGADGPTAAAAGGGEAVAGGDVELIGANREAVRVVGDEARTSVRLDSSARRKVSRSLERAARDAAPDRVFLDLENVRGVSDATLLRVFVGLRADDDHTERHDRLAGGVSLFGVSAASDPAGEHAGSGLDIVLEITRIVDALHLDDAFDVDDLEVRIVPVTPVPEDADITIGRVGLYRQGR
ncbi:tyrosinase family protein [Actinomycetospora sp. C-140]